MGEEMGLRGWGRRCSVELKLTSRRKEGNFLGYRKKPRGKGGRKRKLGNRETFRKSTNTSSPRSRIPLYDNHSTKTLHLEKKSQKEYEKRRKKKGNRKDKRGGWHTMSFFPEHAKAPTRESSEAKRRTPPVKGIDKSKVNMAGGTLKRENNKNFSLVFGTVDAFPESRIATNP